MTGKGRWQGIRGGNPAPTQSSFLANCKPYGILVRPGSVLTRSL
jgi:hypothetical protein